jgi:hypothetical protein
MIHGLLTAAAGLPAFLPCVGRFFTVIFKIAAAMLSAFLTG